MQLVRGLKILKCVECNHKLVYEELFKIFLIVGIETLGFYYLPTDNLFQIFAVQLF